MAIRFDGQDDPVTSTSSPPTDPYTIVCWMRLASDRNTFQRIWASSQGDPSYNRLSTDSDGTTLRVWNTGGNLGGVALTVGTWYRTAVVVSSGSVTFSVGAAGAALTTSTGSFAGPSSPTTLTVANDAPASIQNRWGDCTVAAFRHWSAALTEAEFENELSQYLPVRTANLVRWHPFVAGELTDYSGAARDLTAGATATTTEDGPPIRWNSRARSVLLTPPPPPPATVLTPRVFVAPSYATHRAVL